LEQTVGFAVPEERRRDLARFDARLSPDPGRGELTYRSDSETMNLLMLNLAVEVVRRRKTPEQAQEFARGVLRSQAAGKRSDYTEKLLLESEGARR